MRRDRSMQAALYQALPSPQPMRSWQLRGLLAGVLVVLSWLAGHALAQAQAPTLRTHVTDSAGVLYDRGDAIARKLIAFDRASGNQVFVLTVPTTAGQPIEDYAVQVFQNSKIGQRTLDNGVLFVVATNDHKMRIEVGYGLEGVLTDARSSRILHDVVAPRLQEGQVAAGIEAGVDAILATIAPQSANYLSDVPLPVTRASVPLKKRRAVGVADALIFGVIFLVFWGISLWLGGGLLAFLLIPTVLLGTAHFPDTFRGAFGWWALAAILLPWGYLRSKVIASAYSRCDWFTWCLVFLFVPLGMRPSRGLRWPGTSDGFSSSGGDSGASGGSESAGGGGGSGGGGASASW